MLQSPDIDIVSICVPSGLHAALAVEALEAGKHVLVEKPIDITVDAAIKIEEARCAHPATKPESSTRTGSTPA